jgi:hypothetical protein
MRDDDAERARDLDLRFDVMSFYLHNVGNELPDGYAELVDKSIRPARVAVAAAQQHGDGRARTTGLDFS